jgi:two-component system OmpR family response regulator
VRYDVIVLDWMLPDVDGLTVLRAGGRGRNATPGAHAVGAHHGAGEGARAAQRAPTTTCPKPFDFEELLARLEALHRRAEGLERGPRGGRRAVDRASIAALCGPSGRRRADGPRVRPRCGGLLGARGDVPSRAPS